MAAAGALRLVRRYRHLGSRRAAASAIARVLLPAFIPLLRTRMAPSLRQLVSAGRAFGTADAFIRELLGSTPNHAEIVGALTSDFAVARRKLSARYELAEPDCPPVWAVGHQSALALYSIVRLSRPDIVVETGVADGHSSYLLLSALAANNHGRLISFDVLPSAGQLVPDELRPRWELVILNDRDPIADAAQRLSILDDVDVYFHDADHSYVGQYADYALARDVLSRGRHGILLSDDIDASFAFVDFVKAGIGNVAILVDVRKALGGCILPAKLGSRFAS